MRLEELQRQKFWLEKEIQMAEFIIAAVQSEISPKAFAQAIIDHEIGKMSDEDE